MMSPENCGVFQLLEEVTFWRILAFSQLAKMGLFGVVLGSRVCVQKGWRE